MVAGQNSRKISIEKFLNEIVQNNHTLITSTLSIFFLLNSIDDASKKEIIVNQTNILFDAIIPVTGLNLNSGVSLGKNYEITILQSTELIITMENGAELIDNSEELKKIKLIKVTCF